MKIDLNEKSTILVKDLMARFKTRNEFIGKRYSPFVSELISFAATIITDANVDDITKHLIPSEKRGRVLIKQLEKMYANANPEQLNQLEKNLEKLRPLKNKLIKEQA